MSEKSQKGGGGEETIDGKEQIRRLIADLGKKYFPLTLHAGEIRKIVQTLEKQGEKAIGRRQPNVLSETFYILQRTFVEIENIGERLNEQINLNLKLERNKKKKTK